MCTNTSAERPSYPPPHPNSRRPVQRVNIDCDTRKHGGCGTGTNISSPLDLHQIFEKTTVYSRDAGACVVVCNGHHEGRRAVFHAFNLKWFAVSDSDVFLQDDVRVCAYDRRGYGWFVTAHVALHTSHVTHNASQLTPQTSHLTFHVSHVTRLTSHVTLHTSRHPQVVPAAVGQ